MPKTAIDPYNSTPNETNFGQRGAQITPNDGVDLETVSKGLVVLVSGTLVFIPADNEDDETLTYGTLPVGAIVPYFVRRVLDTGTTATVASIDK
ncbi:hypothetical protein [Mesorhizobium sp. M1B.F.Ca.ET.045.04.1.1]|uniref:spike base protein, RCAP_Rcc01079 family n=1 Tax=Mesorhizobium sp. M1B.F.Ca.ET.045.04.1.1 TaxID=2493673 RepID=UPI000F7629CB|nr:hypothetical protein [Mesorhizobium sp. M1B.F.Ca.ET.045.04.1.1]AZO29425.1 hypothetical protein EJ071_19870 [Mesorhizobium sp. M1B.F.Ca.ET.045.04.1.1]